MSRDLSRLPFLHIYAQPHWHQPAVIRGTMDGLLALKDAVDRAIAVGDAGSEALATDGEGYAVMVERVNVVGLIGPLPYTEEPYPQFRHEEWRNPPAPALPA